MGASAIVPLVSNYDPGSKPLLTPDQVILARRIKFNYHAHAYLQDMSAELTKRLLESPYDEYGRVYDHKAPDRPAYRAVKRVVPRTARRSLDHSAFAEKYPDLYRQAVREVPPGRKFGLYFDRKKNGLWEAVKAQAVEQTRRT